MEIYGLGGKQIVLNDSVEDQASVTALRAKNSKPHNSKSDDLSQGRLKDFHTDRVGEALFKKVKKYINNNNGQWLSGSDGSAFVVINKKRIKIDYLPDNTDLAELFLEASSAVTLSLAAKNAIQRLQIHAKKKAANVKMRNFSAVSEDGLRVYVPLKDGRLLCIEANGISYCDNGTNQDHFWVEHPRNDALDYKPELGQDAFKKFEELIVETQACAIPEMRWFAAMNEALFPYVRASYPARFITVHRGPSQSGKTSGAERFCILHGLGSVKGDFTPAAYANLGDEGLLVMDNKEQANMSQEFIDLLLFHATGAERGRSKADGTMRLQGERPVDVITSIEGVIRPEFKKRCVSIDYAITGSRLPRASLEREIRLKRHTMGAALVGVLQEFLATPATQLESDSPLPEFSEHFDAQCGLLRAYGKVSGKAPDWAEKIIGVWKQQIKPSDIEEEQSDLEAILEQVLRISVSSAMLESPYPMKKISFTWEGVPGELFITNCANLSLWLNKENTAKTSLPKDPSGLGRRLRSAKFESLKVLDDDSAPDVKELRRGSGARKIGIFRPLS